tara:strand:- start:192 stop:329 length:138 start_codon:yes stop_codon:yes gene_type:complete
MSLFKQLNDPTLLDLLEAQRLREWKRTKFHDVYVVNGQTLGKNYD